MHVCWCVYVVRARVCDSLLLLSVFVFVVCVSFFPLLTWTCMFMCVCDMLLLSVFVFVVCVSFFPFLTWTCMLMCTTVCTCICAPMRMFANIYNNKQFRFDHHHYKIINLDFSLSIIGWLLVELRISKHWNGVIYNAKIFATINYVKTINLCLAHLIWV